MLAKRTGWLAAGAVVHVITTSGPMLVVRQHDARADPQTPASVDVSANGRYVAFESSSPLVPADTNQRRDVYVLDLDTRLVTLESTQPGQWIDDARPRLSADGRFLVYESTSAVPTGAAYNAQIIWCDRFKGTSRIVTTAPDGAPADGPSRSADISDDGQVVVFTSNATNLVAGTDANGRGDDIYAFNVSTGSMSRVSVDEAGRQAATGISLTPSISGDGRWVAFSSSAPLTAGGRRGEASAGTQVPRQIYARDLQAQVTVRISTTADGAGGDDTSWAPAVNRDGRFVAFVSEARNLGGGSRNRAPDVFLRDGKTGAMTLVSRGADGGDASGSSASPSISADGRFVAFQSDAPNLVCDKRCSEADQDINLLWDIFVFDASQGTIARVSADATGEWMEGSRGPALDASGNVLAFASRHPIDEQDNADDYDLFVNIKERSARTERH